MSKFFKYKNLSYIATFTMLLGITNSSIASCLVSSPSSNTNLEGTWSAGNYMGNPTKSITIDYTPPGSRKVTTCETVRERGGFPFYGIVEYEQCSLTWECYDGEFFASDIDWITFNVSQIANKQSVGTEYGEWLRFEVTVRGTDMRIWVREGSKNNTIDFVRDIEPFGDNYTWAVLTRE